MLLLTIDPRKLISFHWGKFSQILFRWGGIRFLLRWGGMLRWGGKYFVGGDSNPVLTMRF